MEKAHTTPSGEDHICCTTFWDGERVPEHGLRNKVYSSQRM